MTKMRAVLVFFDGRVQIDDVAPADILIRGEDMFATPPTQRRFKRQSSMPQDSLKSGRMSEEELLSEAHQSMLVYIETRQP